MGKKVAKKGVPKAPISVAGPAKVKKNPLFEKRTRSFRIGGDILPKKDLTRFTRWPQYIRLQRQKRILLQRLKVPSTIAQFSHTADKNMFGQLVRLLNKYKPETRQEKKERLASIAKIEAENGTVEKKAPFNLKFGINHVVDLIENKKAQLVVIAHDVDPIEMVMCLPALCRKKDIPYMFVKGKSRLGQLVNKKTATSVALTQVRKDDVNELNQICESARAAFNDNIDIRRKMGGGVRGVKSQHIMRRRQMIVDKENAKKAGAIVA